MKAGSAESGLQRLEQLLEQVVERPFRQLFGSKLQPVELAKAAERAMRRSQLVGPRGLTVANRYTLRLHSQDLALLSSFKAPLEHEIQLYLRARATQLGLEPVDRWQLDIVADDGVRQGSVRVDAQFLEVAQLEAARLGQTSRLPIDRASGRLPLHAVLVDQSNLARFDLKRELVAIGRALDNDIVLADDSVSRYHAQIRREATGFVLTDLASSNGTFVAGRRVSEAALVDQTEVAFGRFRMTFLVDARATGE